MAVMMRGAIFALLALTASATAAPIPAMTFQLVRAPSPQCAPDCPEWIAAQGQINAGTARDFRAFLARLDRRRRPVLIESNGGSIEDALDMGRLIRARGLAVAVAHTTAIASAADDPARAVVGSAASYPAYCLSACSFVLAAGVERYVSPLATVGVHQTVQKLSQTFVYRRFLVHYRVVNGRREEVSREVMSEDKKTVASTRVSPPALNARLAAYFREMGVDARIVGLMQTATPSQIHDMTAEELIDTRLATVWIWQRQAMNLQREESGLAGLPVQAGATGRGVLLAGQSWSIPAAQFSLELSYRRGGGGVTATFSRTGASAVDFRFALAPGPMDGGVTTHVYPAADFCRLAQIGVVEAREGPRQTPTQALGQPDPRAPLLRAPLASVDGVGRLVDELCPAAVASRR